MTTDQEHGWVKFGTTNDASVLASGRPAKRGGSWSEPVCGGRANVWCVAVRVGCRRAERQNKNVQMLARGWLLTYAVAANDKALVNVG